MTLVRWNPARELASIEIDRLNQMFEDFAGFGRAWVPAVDIFETDGREFVIKAEVPEMKREEIAVTFENGVLTLKGERTPDGETTGDAKGTYHRTERVHGAFSRSFTLPATVDGNRISATYKDGVLTVRVPQRDEVKPRQIAIEA
jgi:HSP20 family protein